MTAIRFATSIVLGLVATTSAFAAEPDAAPAATTTAATTAATTVGGGTVTVRAGKDALAYKGARNARYCFRAEAVTGSHIRRTLCNTRANWEAMGVDLDAALAGR
ncbi:hypothetical protein QLH51_10600 [Sphingomonas sp. 2R-10]|uniref:hypothetical protein n=1 Tax=Sphingomonas sp. 2R-10 TaxID=3045148 RepID=UPI000F795592|nr:hypothetical protein [Sphingomonas sp. 2R-10]MDJ0277243.1 hypothetical protein [Sphingomonas sp. 2R-10]